MIGDCLTLFRHECQQHSAHQIVCTYFTLGVSGQPGGPKPCGRGAMS